MGSGSEHDERVDERDDSDAPADAESDVRIEYAPAPAAGAAIVLVPPEAEEDDEPPSEPERYLDPKPPRRAADALPPRRSTTPPDASEEVTTPRGRRLDSPGDAEPLFTQEWGTASAGSPTWRPGAPPIDPRPERDPWWIGGVIALIAAGAIVLWLALYYA